MGGIYQGIIVTCGSQTVETSKQAIVNKETDLVTLGRPFITNEDFINQIQSESELQDYDVTLLKSL